MSDLSLEKQFVHSIFCQQVKDLEADAAKKLLMELHLLYLNQQELMKNIMKQELARGF
ncbi:MAG: hypothetical protein HC919_00500 [Oscillatoriales cyanobacterium SM2_2_1]|nr:hypothetical protein [Oscillatoriales cyanobacterium SM2_2_1]